MPATCSRRTFLNAAAGGIACAGLSAQAPRAASASPDIAKTQIDDRLAVFAGAGGNVVALLHADGLLLVDSGSPEHSPRLLQALSAAYPGHPITTLLNTHWHLDHTGGNERLGRTGSTIVAHENTRLWLGTTIVSQWDGRTYPPRPRPALPSRTFFYDSETLDAGRDVVEYGHLPQAHTDGDIYVHFRDRDLLVGGDVVAGGRYPLIDYSTGGWIGGMIAGLRTLLSRCGAQTRIIPGSGPLRTRAGLEAQLAMCRGIANRIAASYFRGETWSEFAASQPTRDYDASWGNPDDFLRTAYASAGWHINEMRRGTF